MNNPILAQAMECARRGWPVFPCAPGKKTPATSHGYLDATTDPDQIIDWFRYLPYPNLAVATGAPGPDILDIDDRGPAGNGYSALERLRKADLLDGIAACTRTPNGGLHLYLTGSQQRTAHLPEAHVDFLAQGGYALVPPSHLRSVPYDQLKPLGGDHGLDWAAAAEVLRTREKSAPGASGHALTRGIGGLTRWLGAQRQGNRNAGLYWAANRALEGNPAADLSPLAAAARQAGLDDSEITRTLNSARRTSQTRRQPPDREAEGER